MATAQTDARRARPLPSPRRRSASGGRTGSTTRATMSSAPTGGQLSMIDFPGNRPCNHQSCLDLPSSNRRRKSASQPRTPAIKSSIAVLSSPLAASRQERRFERVVSGTNHSRESPVYSLLPSAAAAPAPAKRGLVPPYDNSHRIDGLRPRTARCAGMKSLAALPTLL